MLLKYAFKVFSTIFDIVVENIAGFLGEKIDSEPILVNNFELSKETFRKRDTKVINTQIVVLSQSNDLKSAINNAVSVCESFKSITGDNEPIYHRFTNNRINITDLHINGAEVIKTTPLESQNFISLPAKELIEEHKLSCIDTFESIVPVELQDGVIAIGKSTYRGDESNVFLSNDKELRNLSLCITGANRSGKTTLVANIIDNLLTAGECVILPDFCGNCELSQYLNKIFPGRTLSIDCADFEKLQGMGYNEIDKNEKNPFKQYRNAKMQCIQLMTLINAVNEEDKILKAKMDRYLEAASLVVFICGGSIRDVLNVLQNHNTRADFIQLIPLQQTDNLKEYIDSLKELDEKNNAGEITGTKFNNIAGIIDRISILKKTPTLS